MCAIDSDNSAKTGRAGKDGGGGRGGALLRIEPVDNWHRAWPRVQRFVQKHGDPRKLRVDADGWLSARQVLMVAFVGDQVAAHVCFSVSPGRACIEAKLDDRGIDEKFAGRGIESQLHRAALDRAGALGCEKLKGFRLSGSWR